MKKLNRPDILKIFLELGGNLNDLKGPLLFEDSEFRPYIIEEFFKIDSPFIRSFLREKFAAEKDEKKKLYLSKYLIRLQEVSGLKFYLDYIRNNKRVPDDSSPANPLFFIYKAEFTYQVLEMVKLSQDPKIIHDDFRDLRSISFNCLRNLVVYLGNYKHVKRMITLWTLKQKVISFFNKDHSYAKFINTLKFYMEGIEQQFNVNNSKVFKIDEALTLYKAASEKA